MGNARHNCTDGAYMNLASMHHHSNALIVFTVYNSSVHAACPLGITPGNTTCRTIIIFRHRTPPSPQTSDNPVQR
jgi:hypothetical protein